MTVLDIAGHVGYICLFFGSQLLARQNKYGWLCRLAGELIWVVLGFFLGLTSIIMWGIFFIFFNDIYGFYKWSKDEKEKEKNGGCPYKSNFDYTPKPVEEWTEEDKRDSKTQDSCKNRFQNFPGFLNRTYFRTATSDDIKQITNKVHEIAEGELRETDPDLTGPTGKRVTKDRPSSYDQDAAWKRRGGIGRSPAPRELVDPKTLTREKLAVMKTWYPELLKKTTKEKTFERLSREGDSKW